MPRSSVTLSNELGWTPFYEEAKISKGCTLYRRIQNNVLDYLINILTPNSQFHSKENRYSNLNYICPKYNRVTEGGRTFNVTAVKLRNSLSIDLRKTLYSFKDAMFKEILENEKSTYSTF